MEWILTSGELRKINGSSCIRLYRIAGAFRYCDRRVAQVGGEAGPAGLSKS